MNTVELKGVDQIGRVEIHNLQKEARKYFFPEDSAAGKKLADRLKGIYTAST